MSQSRGVSGEINAKISVRECELCYGAGVLKYEEIELPGGSQSWTSDDQ